MSWDGTIIGFPFAGDRILFVDIINTRASSWDSIDNGTCTILDCNYNGPDVVEFTKEDYADWTLPENRDLITPTCEITRQNNQAPFNYVYQDSYWDNQEGSNIEWIQGA